MYDVAVIGAGVVGSLIARELCRYRLRVVMLEKADDVAMGTSKANSAIVHAGFDAPVGSNKALFNVRGNQHSKRRAGPKNPYQRRGAGTRTCRFGEGHGGAFSPYRRDCLPL